MSSHSWTEFVLAMGLFVACCHGWLAGRKYRKLDVYRVRVMKSIDNQRYPLTREELDNIRKNDHKMDECNSLTFSTYYMLIIGPIVVCAVWWLSYQTGFDTGLGGEFWYVGIFPPILSLVYMLAHDVIYDMWTGRYQHGGTWLTNGIMIAIGFFIGKWGWAVIGSIAIILIIIKTIKEHRGKKSSTS